MWISIKNRSVLSADTPAIMLSLYGFNSYTIPVNFLPKVEYNCKFNFLRRCPFPLRNCLVSPVVLFWCSFLRNHLMSDHSVKISDISKYFSVSREFSIFWSIPGSKKGMLDCFQLFLSKLSPNYWGLAHSPTKFESRKMNIFRIVPSCNLAQKL